MINSVVAFARNGGTSLKLFHSNRSVSYKDGFPSYMFIHTNRLWDTDADWGSWTGDVEYGLSSIERNAGVDIRGKSVSKLLFDAPRCVSTFRNMCQSHGIPTFEADIPYRRRWLYETQPQIGEYKPFYWDIETDSRTGFQDPARIDGPDLGRIISIAGVDSNDHAVCRTDSSEKRLINEFFKLARAKYGVVVGWNTEYFDVPYVNARARALGMRSPFHGLEMFDLMKIYARVKSPESNRLQSVAMNELGVGKTQEFESRQQAYDLWDSFSGDQKMLTEYNVGDCQLVKGIDEKFKFVKAHEEVANRSSIALSDTVHAGRVVDANVIKTAMKRDPTVVFPTKVQRGEEGEERVTGGLVIDPERGFYSNVVGVDFRGMYPSIIRAFNVSPETEHEFGTAHTQVLKFDPTVKGIFAEALENLIDIRMRERKLKQETSGAEYILHKSSDDVLKQLLNAFYGVIASPYSRFYDRDLANSITHTGQYLIQALAERFESTNFGHAFYGDTDSLFIELKDRFTPFEIEDMSTKYIRNMVELMGGDSSFIEVETQYMFRRFILTDAKKRYFGITTWLGHTQVEKEIIVGLDIKKKNVMQLQKDVMKVLLSIAAEQPDEESARDVAETYLRQVEGALHKGEYDGKLVMKVHMMLPRNEYDGTPMHVRAADLLPDELRLSPGDVIRYTVIDVDDAGKPVSVPVLDFSPHYEERGYHYIFKHYILPMARRIYPGIDVDRKQVKLTDYGEW